MPPPKSSSTCSQCRARKVRCHGGPNACSNCQRLNFDCSFVGSTDATSPSTSQPEKRRKPRACVACRVGKLKCSGEQPACAACRDRGRHCDYPESRRSRQSLRSPVEGIDIDIITNSPTSTASNSQSVFQQSQSRGPDLSGIGSSGTTSTLRHPPGPSHDSHPPAVSPIDLPWQRSASNADFTPSSQRLTLPPLQEQLQLINDFFRHIHPLPTASFLNEVLITQRCLEGALDEALLCSICSLSAMVLKYAKYYPDRTALWIQEAESMIWQNIEDPSIARTQALALIVFYRMETGYFKKAYMLLSLASRFASALRLHYERVDLDHLSQEIRRRLMWSLTMMDSYFSSGLPEVETCPSDNLYLKLPCREEHFHADASDTPHLSDMTALDGVQEDGLLDLYIRQSIVRRDIMRLSRQVMIQSQPMPQLVDIVEELTKTISSARPPEYSLQELRRYAKSRWLTRFVLVQLSWDQCHCDLLRLFLTGYKEAAPDVVVASCPPEYIAKSATLCLEHAQKIIEVLLDLDSPQVNLVLQPLDIGICGYHAARLVLFLSRSNILPSDKNMTPEAADITAVKVLDFLKRSYGDAAIMKHTIEDLEQIIQAQAHGTPAQPKDSSDEEETGEGHHPRFAAAIQRHKTLGIHSMLRRAGFKDNTSMSRAQAATPAHGISGRQTTQETSSTSDGGQVPTPGFFGDSNQPFVGYPAVADYAMDSASLLTLGPETGGFGGGGDFTMEPMSSGTWDSWAGWCWPHDPSTG